MLDCSGNIRYFVHYNIKCTPRDHASIHSWVPYWGESQYDAPLSPNVASAPQTIATGTIEGSNRIGDIVCHISHAYPHGYKLNGMLHMAV